MHDAFALEKLEFAKVISELETFCFSAFGKRSICALHPLEDPAQELAFVREMMDFFRVEGIPTSGGVEDLEGDFQRVVRGDVLGPLSLRSFAGTLLRIAEIQEGFGGHDAQYPLLFSVLRRIHPQPALAEAILHSIDVEGQVLDKASPRLKEIRIRFKRTYRTARQTIERLMTGSLRDFVQDAMPLLRDGRYVVPVKASSRSQVRGIVHSSSSSGATLYMEPDGLVELNDGLRQLQSEEVEEINRILRELTGKIFRARHEIQETFQALQRLDGLWARAMYARKHDAHIPELDDHPRFCLRGLRHPLIGENCVPLDLEISPSSQGIVITGPNTGGKTVSLKMVGLAHLMGLSAIPILAEEGSSIGLFHHVLADIGDEQSIEQSLSTFSGHLRKITSIVNMAGPQSLVLLDELGAGTDPIEGAALALGLLECLVERKTCLLVTSHLTPLKLYAYTNPVLENAAVQFDVQTLTPLYRVTMGVAGSSNAFKIARRLGLPEDVLGRAERFLNEEYANVEQIIGDLQQQKQSLQQETSQVRKIKGDLQQKQDTLQQSLENLKKKKLEGLLDEILDLENQVKAIQKETESLVGELRKKGTVSLQDAQRLNRQVQNMQSGHLGKVRQQVARLKKDREPVLQNPSEVVPGDYVAVVGTNTPLRVLETRKSTLFVERSGLRMEVPLGKARKVPPPQEEPEPDPTPVYYTPPTKNPLFSDSVDLRGMSVDEGLMQVREHLEQMLLSGRHRVFLIHGKGTGRLAEGIWEFLARDPRVGSFRVGKPEEGGTGVTVVSLEP